MAADKRLRCFRCLVTLERLKRDNCGDYLVKVARDDGTEDHICRVCLAGLR